MSDTFTQESWAHDLLTRMGYPTTQNNMTSILAWEYAEGGHFKNAATFNPLNTTLDNATYGHMNKFGVATYPDYETGMQKTISTLNESRYAPIRQDLQNSADPATTFATVGHSKWGTGWSGSPQPLFDRAHRELAKHPRDVTGATTPTPAPAGSTTTTPAPGGTALAAPVAAAPIAATTPTTAQTGFQGADVDGLDKLAQEFTSAAQVCQEVKAACEVIVAAASMFGPFAAAFIAYLKGTVIPWLTKIGEALQAMAKVLSVHSQAQKDASSSATSLPSYVSTGTTPPATTDAPSGVLATIEQAAVAALPLGVGASVLAVGALLGSPNATPTTTTPTTTTAPTEQSAGFPEKPLTPGFREDSKMWGSAQASKEGLRQQVAELTGEKETPWHLAVPVKEGSVEATAFERHGDNWQIKLGEVKADGALSAGFDDKGRGQFGAAGSVEANLADGTAWKSWTLSGDNVLTVADRTTLGAQATMDADASYDPVKGSGAANLGVDAFAGAKTTGIVKVDNPYVSDTFEATAQYGVGYANISHVEFAPGEVKWHVAEGAAFGPGAKLANTVDVHYDRILHDGEEWVRGLFGGTTPPPAAPTKP